MEILHIEDIPGYRSAEDLMRQEDFENSMMVGSVERIVTDMTPDLFDAIDEIRNMPKGTIIPKYIIDHFRTIRGR